MPGMQMLLECSAVICMGQQALVPNSSDPPAATRGAGIPRPPCFFNKGIISKSEFPEQGRGQMIRLKHLLKQMRVCHDQLGPVAPDGCGCWTGGKRNDGYVWGGRHEAHHMLGCPGVQHTDQDGDPPVGGSWPLVSGDASLLLRPPVSQHPDRGLHTVLWRGAPTRAWPTGPSPSPTSHSGAESDSAFCISRGNSMALHVAFVLGGPDDTDSWPVSPWGQHRLLCSF